MQVRPLHIQQETQPGTESETVLAFTIMTSVKYGTSEKHEQIKVALTACY